MSPTIGKFVILGLLMAGWMLLYRRADTLEPGKAYHVAASERDKRKAQFYFVSMWAGLIAAFLSFVTYEGLAGMAFDSNLVRQWVANALHGAGLWGFSVSALVWSQVGVRASQPNSDGKALLPAAQPLRFKE